jgi:DNA invertase Pin-like site-specific DNA recombinase
MKKYGYIRVSAKDQNPNRQIDALQKYGLIKSRIYVDTLSGKDFKRPEYQKLLRKLKQKDVLVVKSIDRLGRNYTEILEQWRIITKIKGADIEVLDMPLLNTNATIEGLTGVFIADMVLQILAYVAETEREFIRQRQAEGIAAAIERGVHFGRTRKELPNDFRSVAGEWHSGIITVREAAAKLGISAATFCRRCHEMEQMNQASCFKG